MNKSHKLLASIILVGSVVSSMFAMQNNNNAPSHKRKRTEESGSQTTAPKRSKRIHKKIFDSVTKGDKKCLKRYIKSRLLDVSTTNDDGDSLLHCTAKAGDVAIMELLLNYQPQHINVLNARNYTPLMCALEKKNTAIAQLLLRYKTIIDVKVVGQYGYTALTLAVHFQAGIEIIKMLLSHNDIDVNAAVNLKVCIGINCSLEEETGERIGTYYNINNQNKTAIIYAAEGNNPVGFETMKLINKHPSFDPKIADQVKRVLDIIIPLIPEDKLINFSDDWFKKN